MSELTKDDIAAVLFTALSEFQDKIGPETTVARLLTLLCAVRNPGIQQTELVNFIKLSQQGVSRQTLALSDQPTPGEQGPDLISIEPDPAYRRRNVLRPTPKATKLIASLADKVNRMLVNRARAN